MSCIGTFDTCFPRIIQIFRQKNTVAFADRVFVIDINEEVVELLVVVGWLALPLCLSIIE